MLTLEGRTCMFSGATGQIGREAVRMMAESGMNVIMTSHMLKDAREIEESLKGSRGEVTVASNQEGLDKLCKEIVDKYGSLDVVISNTGGLLTPEPVDEIDPEVLQEKLIHQTIGPFRNVQAVLPYLRESKAGRIILTTTAGALNGYEGEHLADSVARGAVISMTYALARQLAPEHITVNCIARSGLVNDHTPKTPQDYDVTGALKEIPLGHIGTSEEFGALISYIASEEASFTTGHVLNLTGGLYIG